MESAEVVCRRLIAKRVQTPTLIASDWAVVSCFLSASYVETGKLTVAASEIDQMKAGEVINLSPKSAGCCAPFWPLGCTPLGHPHGT